jgi:hypothetical protein
MRNVFKVFRSTLIYGFCFPIILNAQIPNPALIGYFQNWQDSNSPYIQLDQIDLRYNIVNVSFAIPQAGTDYIMEFIPDQVPTTTFITQIQALQSAGVKVIISIGGATGNGIQPGNYTLLNSAGYPALRGMMTWSINWDAVNTCGNSYEYADNYGRIFGNITSTSDKLNKERSIVIYPNPVTNYLYVVSNNISIYPGIYSVYNEVGELIHSNVIFSENEILDVSEFSKGVYCLKIDNAIRLFIVQ